MVSPPTFPLSSLGFACASAPLFAHQARPVFETKQPRGIAFITYTGAEAVEAVMQATHELGGRQIAVDRAARDRPPGHLHFCLFVVFATPESGHVKVGVCNVVGQKWRLLKKTEIALGNPKISHSSWV